MCVLSWRELSRGSLAVWPPVSIIYSDCRTRDVWMDLRAHFSLLKNTLPSFTVSLFFMLTSCAAGRSDSFFSWLMHFFWLSSSFSCAETLLVPMCSVDYQIRLLALARCSGRVKVFYNNISKALCDESWGALDAVVACRQLGCGSPLNTSNWNESGPRKDQISLNLSLGCSGQEGSLEECPNHNWTGVRNCSNTKEAVVTCSGDWGDVHTKIQNSKIYLM